MDPEAKHAKPETDAEFNDLKPKAYEQVIGDQENDMTHSGLDEFVGVSLGADRDGDSASSR